MWKTFWFWVTLKYYQKNLWRKVLCSSEIFSSQEAIFKSHFRPRLIKLNRKLNHVNNWRNTSVSPEFLSISQFLTLFCLRLLNLNSDLWKRRKRYRLFFFFLSENSWFIGDLCSHYRYFPPPTPHCKISKCYQLLSVKAVSPLSLPQLCLPPWFPVYHFRLLPPSHSQPNLQKSLENLVVHSELACFSSFHGSLYFQTMYSSIF